MRVRTVGVPGLKNRDLVHPRRTKKLYGMSPLVHEPVGDTFAPKNVVKMTDWFAGPAGTCQNRLKVSSELGML